MVKFLSMVRFRSGVRVEMISGGRVLDHLRMLQEQNHRISVALSAKQDQTAEAVLRMQEEVNAISSELAKRLAHRLTGQVAGKAVPIVGGIVSGFITGSGFDEMAKRLLAQLKRHGA